METIPSITLLHLSDLQIGRHHRFEGDTGLGSLLDRVGRDLDKLRDREGVRPDLVLLTGDLSEWGLRSELEQVARFAAGLGDMLGLPARRVVLLPGNHDINRKLSEAYFAECVGDEREPVLPYWPKYKPFAEMFAHFYQGDTDIRFTSEEPWSFFEYPDLRVVVAALNSTIADSHREGDHYGFLGERQLRWFAERLRPYRERGWLRIGAVHHDVMAPEAEPARQDKKDLEGMLAPHLNLLLHGHTHVEQVQWLDGATLVPMLGIGSAGVKAAERPAEVPNQYQIVQVFADRLAFRRRAYVPDRKDWIECLRSDPDGKVGRIEKRVSFDRVEATFSGTGQRGNAPDTDLAEVVAAYRAYWAKTDRRVGLFDAAGMAEDADIPGGLDLLHVFVPQCVRRDPPARDLPHSVSGLADVDVDEAAVGKSRRRAEVDEWRRSQLVIEGPAESVQDLLVSQAETWVTILGAPGGGKTALTRWLALRLCAPGEALPDALRDIVPVRIELRRFDKAYRRAKAAGAAYDFLVHLDEVHRERSLRLRGDLLEKLADSGRLLWLFDGLDEVPDARARAEYARMIAGIRMRYGGRGLVTSRIVGARPVLPILEGAGIGTHTLQDFEEQQVQTFVDRWHSLAFPGATEVGERRKARLLRTIEESSSVRELCKNPLLLTLIALLNRGGELPRRRHLVYERAVDLLVEKWEANKHLSISSAERLDPLGKKKLLRELAWKMMTELPGGSGNVVGEEELLSTFAGFYVREMGEGTDRAKSLAGEILQELRDRNGILALLGGQAFGFLHKTFLEYLAAAEVLERFSAQEWDIEQVKKMFVGHWRDPAWTEVLTLVCGMLQEKRPANVVELVQAVLATAHPFERHYDHALAFGMRCLVEVRVLSSEPARGLALALTEAAIRTSALETAGMADYAGPLHMAGPDWPGAARFELALLSSPPDSLPAYLFAPCVGATASPATRLDLVERLVAAGHDPFTLEEVLTGQAKIKPWSPSEVEKIAVLVRDGRARDQVVVLRGLVKPGIHPAAERLVQIANEVDDSDTALRVARELLRSGRHERTALRVIRRVLDERAPVRRSLLLDLVRAARTRQGARDAVRSRVAGHEQENRLRWEMACLWRDEAALQAAVGAVHAGQPAYVRPFELLALSATWPAAKAGLECLLEDAERILDERAKLEASILVARRDRSQGLRLLTSVLPISHLHWGGDAMDELVTLCQPGDLALKELIAAVLKRKERSASSLRLLVRLSKDVPAAREAIETVAAEEDEPVRLHVAQLLAEQREPKSQDAQRLLIGLAISAKNEEVRLHAATTLRRIDGPVPVWRDALRHLSRHARTGYFRLLAAKALHDEKRIEALSRKAKKADVREEANNALEALRAHRAILEVGRKRRGRVLVDGTLAGHIEEVDQGTRFTYDPAYLAQPDAIPIAPTLPLRREPYESPGLHPFFENLLPEGWLFDLTCRKLGIDRTDAFGLLLATCADCAGAIEIVPERKAA